MMLMAAVEKERMSAVGKRHLSPPSHARALWRQRSCLNTCHTCLVNTSVTLVLSKNTNRHLHSSAFLTWVQAIPNPYWIATGFIHRLDRAAPLELWLLLMRRATLRQGEPSQARQANQGIDSQMELDIAVMSAWVRQSLTTSCGTGCIQSVNGPRGKPVSGGDVSTDVLCPVVRARQLVTNKHQLHAKPIASIARMII